MRTLIAFLLLTLACFGQTTTVTGTRHRTVVSGTAPATSQNVKVVTGLVVIQAGNPVVISH